MTRIEFDVEGAPVFANEAEFQHRVRLVACDSDWGVTSAAARQLDADLAAYGQPPAELDGIV